MFSYGKITVLIAGLFFILGLIKYKNGMYFLIFFIPYEGMQLRNVGVTGFCIIGYFVGYCYAQSRLNNSVWKNVYYKKYILLIIISIIISLFMLAIRQDYSDLNLGFGVNSITGPLLRYMLNIIASIMLYILISNEAKTHKDILNYIWVFILSLSYVFMTWIGSFIYHLNLPRFLRVRYSGEGFSYNYTMRFAGYVGEYGLQSEYFMFIIAFSLLLIFLSKKKLKRKLIPSIAMVISIPMAISTGTRAFVVIIFLFAIIFIFFILSKEKVSIAKKLLIIGSTIIIIGFLYIQIINTYLWERMIQIENIGQSINYISEIDKLLNRPYITEFNNVIETGALFGVGPLYIIGVKGNNMAWHSLYYDLLIKFGILGLLIYLFFYSRLLLDLYKKIKSKEISTKFLPIIFFSLFISLLIGEYARSYQNQTSFMLMYWFLFAIIACVNNMKKSLLQNKLKKGKKF